MTDGLDDLGKGYDEFVAKIEAGSKKVDKTVDDLDSVFNDMSKNTKKEVTTMGKYFTVSLVDAVNEAASKIPKEIKTKIKIDDSEVDEDVARAAADLLEANKKFTENVKFEADLKMDREAKDAIEMLTGTGKYKDRDMRVISDDDLKYLEQNLGNMKWQLAQASEAVEDTTDVELDVPDDEKFKAAQEKLLKEIDTNADIMQTKMKTFAELAESDAERVSSSFEAISESMTSTGDVLTELYKQMEGAGTDIFAQQAIQAKISAEEERREEAFNLQKQLTTAQIDLIKQRSAAMAAGDPMITVSGDGLQPHLEAFMWEVLSAIQVRVNEDYGNFLLGIGAE